MSQDKLPKEIYEVKRPPYNWKELMSRETKRFRNRWNTEIKPRKKDEKK